MGFDLTVAANKATGDGDDQDNHNMTSPASDPTLMLDQQFYIYQVQGTGQPSTTRLTLRQLCRMLISPVPLPVTPQTNLLAIQPDGTYAPDGWRPAQSVPVLKECCSRYYFEDKQGSTQGPVGLRDLAKAAATVNNNLRVYATDGGDDAWDELAKLPNVQLAMAAIADANISSEVHQLQQTASAQDELESFLSHTEEKRRREDYESDGGTKYVKDWQTGRWIHESLVAAIQGKDDVTNNGKSSVFNATNLSSSTDVSTGPKKKKAKFSAKNAKCWIYLSNLPRDVTVDELELFCKTAGILAIDPATQAPKIKLYTDAQDQLKGDASVCYARPESVTLALEILDGAQLRPLTSNGDSTAIKVEQAHFSQHGKTFDATKSKVSDRQRKVAQLAALQQMDWDDAGDINGRLTGGRKGLRIIVMQPLFRPVDVHNDDAILENLDTKLRSYLEERFGAVEKITVFSQHPNGVVIVKFVQPSAATATVQTMHGQTWPHGKEPLQVFYWDGVTDYTQISAGQASADEAQRVEAFGDWIEEQNLPHELQLQVEKER